MAKPPPAGLPASTATAAGVPPMVLVTRPQPQADEWVASLQALGCRAVALPLLGIAPPADLAPVRAAWAALAGTAPGQPTAAAAGLSTDHPTDPPTDQPNDQPNDPPNDQPNDRRSAPPPRRALAQLPAVVMFVSPSAVDRFFALKPAGLAWPAGVIAAGTGPGTGRALLAAEVPAAAVLTPPDDAARFDSEALWGVLRSRVRWAGSAALIVRGEGGRDWLADTLRRHGARVHFVEAYRRTVPVLDAAAQAALQEALAQPMASCWLFSSSEAVGHLPALAPGFDWSQALALATHPRIAAAARQLGVGRVVQVLPSPEAVAEWLRADQGPARSAARCAARPPPVG